MQTYVITEVETKSTGVTCRLRAYEDRNKETAPETVFTLPVDHPEIPVLVWLFEDQITSSLDPKWVADDIGRRSTLDHGAALAQLPL